jgi:hypothetical protein
MWILCIPDSNFLQLAESPEDPNLPCSFLPIDEIKRNLVVRGVYEYIENSNILNLDIL